MAREYLNNKEFEATISRFMHAKNNLCHNSTEYHTATNELMEVLYLLVDNIVRAFNFQLLDKDDALQEGVMTCFDKVGRFNPNYIGKNGQKAKAFNYLTTVCLNSLRGLYRTSKNYNEFKQKYRNFIEYAHIIKH